MWGRVAGLVSAVAVGAATASCAWVADPGQKDYVRKTLAAVPQEVSRALRLGDVRLHYNGASGVDVTGDREIGVPVEAAPGTTTGAWVQGCRALVAALGGTPARLYGRIPGQEPLHEATDELCRRGLGHPLGSSEDPRLVLGLSGADTGIDVDAERLLLTADGREPREAGAALAVAAPDLAAWDAALPDTPFPWHYTSQRNESVTFVVPAGTRLWASAECGVTDPRTHAEIEPRAGANYVSFLGGPPPSTGGRPCGERLNHSLSPQLSYATADGRQVDRYDVVVMPFPQLARTGEPPVRKVTVDRE